MRRPRFRLRSLMILVLLAALIMGAALHLSRIDPEDALGMEQRLFRILPVLILVLAKLGLIAWTQSRRRAVEIPTEARPVDEPVRDETPS